ncbi:MAG: NAD(P)/FAD-dependent oxidoreductase [Halolamina sp.]
MSRVVVVGAGLAGLVAARHLADAGHEVSVFERRESVGGRVRSREVDDVVCDRGFQVLFTSYPAVRRELDLDALDLRRFTPGACIGRDGQRSVLSDPLRDPGALVESAFNREVTTVDKLRTLLLERDVRRDDPESLFDGDDATIREYLQGRGFSERYVERFVAPFYGGITLDRSLSTSKQVFEYTFRAMSHGAIAVPADGMGAIPRQLAARATDAGAEVVTGEAVVDLDHDREGAAVETEARSVAADAVVVAAGPKRAAELTDVAAIPTDAKPSVTAHLRLPDEPRLDGGERIHLNADGEAPNTIAPMSAVAPEYVPDGEGLLVATFLGEDALETDAERLCERTRTALSSWYPEYRFDGLEPVAVDRIEFAQFAQPPGFRDGLPAVEAPEGPVVLAGDYTEWSSIQGAMKSGLEAAAAVGDRVA